MISDTAYLPSVSVPVLSNITVSAFERASIYCEPLTSIPRFELAPIPLKNESGTEIISAHGHDTTRNISALSTHSCLLGTGKQSGITIPKIAAHITTAGV